MKLPAVRPEVSSHKLFSTGLRPSSQCQTSAMQCRGLGQNLDWLDLGRLGLDGWAASSPGILGSKETAEAAREPNRIAIEVKCKIHVAGLARKEGMTRKDRRKKEGSGGKENGRRNETE
jgi:hypothetical protein